MKAPALSTHRLLAMARKEWIQVRRDPRSLALAFAMPLLLLLVFAYAITWDVRNISLYVLDQDRSRQSRALIDAFRSSGYFTIAGHLAGYGEVDGVVGTGDAGVVLILPPDFARKLASGDAEAQVILDGSDANTAIIAFNYADAITARWSGDLSLRPLEPPVRPESRVWYNPTLESRNMIVPGLIAVIMMIIAAILTAMTIAREWERGTMEQLASTPVHRLEIILGKLLPYLVIALIDVAAIAVVGVTLFGVPFRGNVLLFFALTTLFLVGALGLGLFISAAAKTQFVATQMAFITTLLPAMLLSGFLFEIAAMPVPLQAITYLVPARFYIVVTKGIFLKGVGVEVLWTQWAFMLAFAVLGLGAAALVFRKEIG